MTRAFTFSLAPKLEALLAERRACEESLDRARRALADAAAQTEQARALRKQLAAQQAERGRRARELEGPQSSEDLARWDARQHLLVDRERQAAERERRLAEQEEFARQVVSLRVRDLESAFERVRALEKLRDVQQRQAAVENERVRQLELDEAAQRAWLDRGQRESRAPESDR